MDRHQEAPRRRRHGRWQVWMTPAIPFKQTCLDGDVFTGDWYGTTSTPKTAFAASGVRRLLLATSPTKRARVERQGSLASERGYKERFQRLEVSSRVWLKRVNGDSGRVCWNGRCAARTKWQTTTNVAPHAKGLGCAQRMFSAQVESLRKQARGGE